MAGHPPLPLIHPRHTKPIFLLFVSDRNIKRIHRVSWLVQVAVGVSVTSLKG